jgi:hypothetical protein
MNRRTYRFFIGILGCQLPRFGLFQRRPELLQIRGVYGMMNGGGTSWKNCWRTEALAE